MHLRLMPSMLRSCKSRWNDMGEAVLPRAFAKVVMHAAPQSRGQSLQETAEAMRPLLKRLATLPLSRKEQALAYLSLVNARSKTRQHIMQGSDEEVMAAIRPRIRRGTKMLFGPKKKAVNPTSVADLELALAQQLSKAPISSLDKQALQWREVTELAAWMQWLHVIEQTPHDGDRIACKVCDGPGASGVAAPLHAQLGERVLRPALWPRHLYGDPGSSQMAASPDGSLLPLDTEDLVPLWDAHWGWGGTWRRHVTTWDGLQSEAVAWVDAITKNNCWPTMIPNHCQTYRHVFDDHFVSQLMHPICYVSFSGLYGQDLEFSAEAPPLPAAGHVRLSINVHGLGRTLVPVLAVQRAFAPRYNGGKAPVPAAEGEAAHRGVQELCSYMEAGGYTHGLLCSDIYFWFVKALGDGNGFAISSPLKYDQKGPTVLAALAYMVHLSIKETSPASGGSEGTVAGERRRGRPKSIQKMEVKQATGTQATPAPAASVPTSQPLVHGVTEGPHDSSAVLTSGGGAVSNQQPPCGGPATYCLPDLVNASRVNASQAGLQPLLQGVRTALHDSSAVDAFDFRECLERPSLSPATYSATDLGLAGTRPLLLGHGNLAACYQGCFNGVPVAVKVPKFSSTEEYTSTRVPIQSEVAAYQRLAPLQGKVVPRLVAHGTLARTSGCQAPFLATQSLSHAPPLLKAVKELGLTAEEMRRVAAAAWTSLKAVHDLGVAHHSIHEGNLLLEFSPGPGGKCTVWLIDLQRAVVRPDCSEVEADQDGLTSMLMKMVEGLPNQGAGTAVLRYIVARRIEAKLWTF